jgi:hypothetical protein
MRALSEPGLGMVMPSTYNTMRLVRLD